jgi:hypothetical protein
MPLLLRYLQECLANFRCLFHKTFFAVEVNTEVFVIVDAVVTAIVAAAVVSAAVSPRVAASVAAEVFGIKVAL